MDLPKLSDFDISEKKAIVRLDLDVPQDDLSRIESSLETLNYLTNHNATLLLIGHKGRPDGVKDPNLSLLSLVDPIGRLIKKQVMFVEDFNSFDFDGNGKVYLLENLRFEKGEEENSEDFAKSLASKGDFYINEAFAVSHRSHASIVGIPKFLPHAAGFRLVNEIEHLNKVIENPERPLVFLISGIKEDKLEMIEALKPRADKVLVGGRLPEYLKDDGEALKDAKLLIAQLNQDKEDITLRSIENFEKEIAGAKTIVLGGVVGKYEDGGQRLGTKRVFEAVARASAYKIAGGGDTEAALSMFNLTDKFDWVSVGGGAMLEFLAKGTLPGIEALK